MFLENNKNEAKCGSLGECIIKCIDIIKRFGDINKKYVITVNFILCLRVYFIFFNVYFIEELYL